MRLDDVRLPLATVLWAPSVSRSLFLLQPVKSDHARRPHPRLCLPPQSLRPAASSASARRPRCHHPIELPAAGRRTTELPTARCRACRRRGSHYLVVSRFRRGWRCPAVSPPLPAPSRLCAPPMTAIDSAWRRGEKRDRGVWKRREEGQRRKEEERRGRRGRR